MTITLRGRDARIVASDRDLARLSRQINKTTEKQAAGQDGFAILQREDHRPDCAILEESKATRFALDLGIDVTSRRSRGPGLNRRPFEREVELESDGGNRIRYQPDLDLDRIS